MKEVSFGGRATGRTLRMLEHVVDEWKRGREIRVIAATEPETHRLRVLLHKMVPDRDAREWKIHALDRGRNQPPFDWFMLRFPGDGPERAAVDHFAAEREWMSIEREIEQTAVSASAYRRNRRQVRVDGGP